MSQPQEIDLGSVQVHKKAIADIAFSSLREIDGVHLVENDFKTTVLDILGIRGYSGITVTEDESRQVSIELKLVIRYGLNVPEIAREVQDIVRAAVLKAVDLHLKDVIVNVQGIEREEL